MVAHKDPAVKDCSCCGRDHATHREHWLCWFDCHPRVAWWWVLLLALNTILNILDLTGFGR